MSRAVLVEERRAFLDGFDHVALVVIGDVGDEDVGALDVLDAHLARFVRDDAPAATMGGALDARAKLGGGKLGGLLDADGMGCAARDAENGDAGDTEKKIAAKHVGLSF